MASFPSIGEPDFGGFSVTSKPAVLRTQMEGYVKQSKRFSKKYIERSVSYTLSTANKDTFVTFVNDTLGFGADSFTWTDPEDSVAKTATIVNGEYSLVPMDPSMTNWRVAFKLETLES